jgi:dihydrofolate reductase
MRKLKLQVQITLDGFIAGPIGEMDWMVWDWDEELKKYVDDITEPVDCIVLGRKLADGFIPHWANVAANPDNSEYAAGRKFTDTKKIVFSKTLDKSDSIIKPWNNTYLAKGDLVGEINQLKAKKGKDIIAYGGANFVSQLVKYGLIDEFHLFVNPVAIGKGMTIFSELESMQNLTLIESTKFNCGIVVLKYKPKHI